jgi:hypothetical protein
LALDFGGMKVSNFEVLSHGGFGGAIRSMAYGAFANEKIFCGSVLRHCGSGSRDHQKQGTRSCVSHAVSPFLVLFVILIRGRLVRR